MKKSFIFGAALMCACAFGLQSCDQVDNPGAPTTDEMTADIQAGTDLSVLVSKYAVDGVLTLPAEAEVTLSGALEVDEPLTITSDEKSPAKVTFTGENAGFVVGNGLTLKNVDFECSASNAAFITLSKNPTIAPITANLWNTDYNLYLLKEPITVANCTIDNLNSFFLTDVKMSNNGAWFLTNVLVDNCLVHLTTQTESTGNAYFYLNNGGGFAQDLTVKNSTFYNTTEFGFRYFVRYGGFSLDNVKDAFGWEKNTLAYENSTFYNVCQNDGQWGNYNGIYRAETSFWVMKNCIFWNCSTSGSVPRRFLHGKGGRGETAIFLNNTYMTKDGGFQDPQNYDESGTNIEEDPHFADPANGDFHISGSKQAELGTGDPRWL
ncbi:MAG: DUF4957 domain-containing protein [Prevotella sp.]|nr:DUF4957 domain-containing protein [Prevotella sp.]